MKLKIISCLLIFGAFSFAMIGHSHAQTPYFQGKTVTIIVGTVAGDLYDLYARAIALFMGRYLTGNPNIIVQHKVMSIPTLMLFNGGKMVERVTGYQPKAKLAGKFSPHF